MRGVLVALLATVASGSVPSSAAPLSFDLTRDGLTIRAGKQTVVRGSRIVAVEPPWVAHRFYSKQAKMERRVERPESGDRIVLSSDDPRYPFKLWEYSAVGTSAGVRVTINGGLSEALPTAVEYTALVVPANVLAGARYEAVLGDGSVLRGRLAGVPGSSTAGLPAFQSAALVTACGTLRITVTQGAPLTLTDRRVNLFDDQRCFWVGVGGVPASPENPFRHTVTLSFDEKERLAGPTPLPRAGDPAPPVHVDDLVRAGASAPPLLPAPRERSDGTGWYTPADGDPLRVEVGNSAEGKRLRRAAQRILLGKLGLPLRQTRPGQQFRRGISIQVIGSQEHVPASARVPEQPEGYWLQSTETGVTVIGRDLRGAFYGLQTIRLLMRDGKLPVTVIRDWPDYALRGVHLLADGASLAFHGRLIEDLFAPLKMNHIVFEVEYARWDATRELHQPWGMTKKEMRALAKLAEENFIEVTPLVQTLGHCEWLFVGGKNAEWAEDPDTRYAYDASNPAVYALLQRMLDEVVEVFRPRFLHIGHDEVDMRGRYPFRPANVAKGAPEVVLDDILWFHRYASRRGIRLMMWHDMLITKAEGAVAHGGPPLNIASIRPRVPKDIVLVDWQYTPKETYPEVATLRAEGFDVVGATWHARGNVEKFAAYGHERGMMGMLQTTWTGYHGNKTALEAHFGQIAAYVRAGDRFWNAGEGGTPTYDDGQVLGCLVPARPNALAQVGRGRLLDVSPWANVLLRPDADPFALGDAIGLETLPEGRHRFGDALFQVARREGAPAAIGVRSPLGPSLPESVDRISISGKARALLFLHTTPLFAPAGSEVGQYSVHYADGTELAIPIRYGREIACPADEPNYYLWDPTHSWDYQGRRLHLWMMRWENPRPQDTIASLSLRAVGAEASPTLLAISVAE